MPESRQPNDVDGMPTLGDLVLRYVTERAERGELATTSARSYRENLWLFATVTGLDRRPATVTRRHVELFLARGRTRGTKRQRLSIIKGFFGWCQVNGYVRKNPAANIPSVPVPRSVPRALRAAQVTDAIGAARDPRERVAISLMVQEMLRAQEVAGLELGDIDLDERLLLVRKGKGGHQRVLPISAETAVAVARYLDQWPARSGPLIRSYLDPAAPIQPRYLSALVAKAMHRAGIAETGHALRHTGASDMLERGANIREVQIALGHASLGTTQRYLRWSDGRNLRKAMGGREYARAIRPTTESSNRAS